MNDMKKNLARICQAIADKKGEEVCVLDVSKISSFTSYFVICQGQNARQNQAICDEIVEMLKRDRAVAPLHVEGYQHAEWILLDYIDFVIHIFLGPTRKFYKLEKLWSDGVEIEPAALSA